MACNVRFLGMGLIAIRGPLFQRYASFTFRPFSSIAFVWLAPRAFQIVWSIILYIFSSSAREVYGHQIVSRTTFNNVWNKKHNVSLNYNPVTDIAIGAIFIRISKVLGNTVRAIGSRCSRITIITSQI